MANVLTVIKVSRMMAIRKIRYQVRLSGNYVQAVRGSNVGEVLDLTNIVGKYDPDQYWGQQGPLNVNLMSAPAGLTAKVIPGADVYHWLLQVFSTTPATEFSAGAYSAALLADLDIFIEAEGGNFK
jgi:hypothetical protein